ncbi:MAG: SDR family oxidoreductase [Salinivirgaceae bacterium]|nr:SDR family oxidoreductase [Salinivirgaceae bacterium]
MKNCFSVEDKKVVITGASSGIGRHCAISLSKWGAICILIARNQHKLEETRSLMDNPEKHSIFAIDITNEDLVTETMAKVNVAVGPIDGFIHAAGIEKTKPLKMHTKSDFMDVFELNAVAGVQFIQKLSHKNFVPSTGASFIFISSITAMRGFKGKAAYGASKAALSILVQTIAQELAPKNIRVNAILPTMVNDTEITNQIVLVLPPEQLDENRKRHPLGWVDKEDVANACIFLLSKASKKITGTNLIIDGGYCTT